MSTIPTACTECGKEFEASWMSTPFLSQELECPDCRGKFHDWLEEFYAKGLTRPPGLSEIEWIMAHQNAI